LVPLDWSQLAAVDAVELIAHRLVWSLVFFLAVIFWRSGRKELRAALGTGRSLGLNLPSSVLLAGNWLVYVRGINSGHVIGCSLGYFLVPLLNAALGRWVLGGRLRSAQFVVMGCATVGIAVQLVQVGRLPWIALALAVTFGGYGLLRKRSPLGPLRGFAVETALLAPAAAVFLLWRQHTGEGALGHASATLRALVPSTGIVTAVPLLLFAYGARRIRLTALGLLQYIAPTVRFTLGVFVFHKTFDRNQALAFAFIWAGLVLYTIDDLRNLRAVSL